MEACDPSPILLASAAMSGSNPAPFIRAFVSPLTVLAPFSSEFSRPTWKNIQILIIGAILSRGPRRISSVLRVMGLSNIKNFSKYHRFLSRLICHDTVLAKTRRQKIQLVNYQYY